MSGTAAPDHRPRLPGPADRPGIAVLGCGAVARNAHLPAYGRYGLDVVGVHSRNPAAVDGVREAFPFVRTVYASVDDLLADPRVGIVDIATGPAGRAALVRAAVEAGKHVLVQKPLAADAGQLAALLPVLEEAQRRGLRVAVNQNGRWAPPWRLATLLVRDGAVGAVVGVTHLHDKPLPPIAGTPFDDVEHMLVTDYLVHWTDITREWLRDSPIRTVAAVDGRPPGQPDDARNPWSATVTMTCANGAGAVLRVVGDVRASAPGCPFWVHGTEGTLRGSVLGGSDRLSLDRDGVVTTFPLEGQWFTDGFAGTMGELMCAVAEGREPEHSASSVVGAVRVTLAALESVRRDGVPVAVEGAA
jgi:predicted dehydrogenase